MFTMPSTHRRFLPSQETSLDPFLSSPIEPRASRMIPDLNSDFDTSRSFYVATASSDLGASTPRSSLRHTPLADYSTNPYLDNSQVTSVSQIAPFLDRIRRFDISDDTFHVLDSIDPTFWSLETYIQTCARISSDSKQMLPLGYYASLVLLTKVLSSRSAADSDEESINTEESICNKPSIQPNDSTYYYDKLAFVRHPLKTSTMLRDALETIQEWMQENEQSMSSSSGSALFNSGNSSLGSAPGLSATNPTEQYGQERRQVQQRLMTTNQHNWNTQLEQHVYQAQILEDLRSTVSRFIFVLDQLDKNSSDVECYQSRNWPNASCADKLVRYFPIFDGLLPVRSTSEKALSCLDAFLPQLEGLMGTHTLDPFEMAYFYQTTTTPKPSAQHQQAPQQLLKPWWMEILIKKVEAWQTNKHAIEGSPRKRSFTVMDDDVVGHFRRPSDAMRGRPKKLRRPSL